VFSWHRCFISVVFSSRQRIVRRLSAIAATLVTLAAGLAGGLALTSRLLDAAYVPGAARYGAWVLWPRAGAPDPDPYTAAFFARRGDIAMAPAEGLAFHAIKDDMGAPLTAACTYRIGGGIPAARAWSLTAYRPDGSLAENPARRNGLTSAEALGGTAQTEITVSFDPGPGNWLPLPQSGPFHLVLRLYDTPLTAISAALDPDRLPRISRTDCRP
jgi:hypothetical protein